MSLSIDVERAVKELESLLVLEQAVERAQYDVDLARQRFMRVDPNHRLVADSLEADWNAKLRALGDTQAQCRQQRDADRVALNDEHRTRILALATDVPRLWRDPATPDRERKRMLRLIIQDVTLLYGQALVAHIRFRGGATRTLTLRRPPRVWVLRKTNPDVVAEIDRLVADYTDVQIACVLAEQGVRSGMDKPITPNMVRTVRERYHLRSRYERLRERGLLTLAEVAGILHVTTETVKHWRRAGLLRAHAYNDKHAYLYEPPGADAPVRYAPKGITHRDRARRSASHPTHEVQYEA